MTTLPWTTVIYQRSGGRCEANLCRNCTGWGEQYHHRKLRSRGGKNTASCGVHVCHQCHDYIHRNPARATELGWMVSTWAEPDEVPLWRYHRTVLLSDDGGMTPTEAPA